MAKFAFNKENIKKTNELIAKYPEGYQKSAIISLLDLAQRQEGWVSDDAMRYIAELLSVSHMEVYEVANFYTMIHTKPVGKFHVEICTNISCMLRGSADVLEACKKFLKIKDGEITKDGMFSIKECECLGACANAPAMRINDDYYEDLTPDTAVKILEDLKEGKTPKTGSQIGRKSSEPCENCQCKGKKE